MKRASSKSICIFLSVILSLPALAGRSGMDREGFASAILIIAHRGGLNSGIPENTLLNFEMTINKQTDIIEVDLRSSRDGEIVIIHDATLNRTTNGSGSVSDYTLQELNELDAGQGEKIPAFAELLALIQRKKVKLLLDIKNGPHFDIGKMIDMTEAYRCTGDVIAGVRSLEDLHLLKKRNPNIRTLGFIRKPEEINMYIDDGVDMIRLWPEWIEKDTQVITWLREKNVPVWVTVPDLSREDFSRLIDCGVTGFITDHPDKLHSMLENIRKK